MLVFVLRQDYCPSLVVLGKQLYSNRFFFFFLEEAADAGVIHEEILYMDSTHIKANTNKRVFADVKEKHGMRGQSIEA